jgi:hypothetical protein
MSSISIAGDTSGSITLAAPAVAGTNTITLPALTGTTVIAGQNSAITAGTAVASTSGTSIDFTSIPSWVKRITVMLNGVSTSGTSNLLIQIGSGSVTSSGYASSCSLVGNNVATQCISSTSGFSVIDGAASQIITGALIINNISSNTWIAFGNFIISGTTYVLHSSGASPTLGGTLDRVRITGNGTDTFDAGSINILYE